MKLTGFKSLPILILITFIVCPRIFYAQHAEKTFNRGYHYLSIDLQKAIQYLSESINIDPNRSEAYYFRGIAQYKQDAFYPAIKDFGRAIDLDSNLVLVNIYTGFAYRRLNKMDSAIHYFNKYIEENPADTSAYAYILRGKIKFESGDIEGSLKDFDRAALLNPIEEKYYYYKFLSFYDLEQYDQALVEINDAININPDFYGYYFYRGNTYYGLKQFEKAIVDYSHALDFNVENADIYYFRGLAEEGLQNVKGAIEDYNTAIAYNPNDGTYYFQRGHAKMAIGNKQGACDDWYEAGALGYYADFEKIRAVCE
ncbi:MAG: tetratricopeptide repeat protein [Cyclobacteriaceae bacterium]|nr:tetratricopeptide repeat protein [Cyclobacteriaceae bacterium]